MEGQSFDTRICYPDYRANWNRNGNDIPHNQRPCRGPSDRGYRTSLLLPVLEIWGSKTPFSRFFQPYSRLIISDCGKQNSIKFYKVYSSYTIARANTFPWKHVLRSCSPPKLTPFQVFEKRKTAFFAIAISR